ncbi:ABC transporter permease [Halomicrococcus sp. NG-SE-24]|uniref:ABC transporter permease n=1 Tax=Halomicrococcus sp. NG-SE-24 TaxID=3436928 RepID=UPI003D9827D2
MSTQYIAKRFGRALFTVFAVISLSFGLTRLMPGGPVDALRAQLIKQNADMSMSEINQRLATYTNVQPDEPLYVQYFQYLGSVLQGDFGRSIWRDVPVMAVLGDALPWTILIMTLALLLMFGIGVSLGAVLAYREGTTFDLSGSVVSLVLSSTPYYVAAILFVYILGYQLSWFPTGGRYGTAVEPGFTLAFVTSVLYHAALPVLSLAITGFGGWALTMRGNSISILGKDYLRVARLRGLSERRIAFRYVGWNAILPMYTGLMISVGMAFGGSVILEQIFSYPGVGYYMFRAIGNRDYPMMMGAFLLITLAVVIGILIADLTYTKLDPRIESGGSDEI